MLVLSTTVDGEPIVIQTERGAIYVHVVEIRTGQTVRLGFVGPKEVTIDRLSVHLAKRETAGEAR